MVLILMIYGIRELTQDIDESYTIEELINNARNGNAMDISEINQLLDSGNVDFNTNIYNGYISIDVRCGDGEKTTTYTHHAAFNDGKIEPNPNTIQNLSELIRQVALDTDSCDLVKSSTVISITGNEVPGSEELVNLVLNYLQQNAPELSLGLSGRMMGGEIMRSQLYIADPLQYSDEMTYVVGMITPEEKRIEIWIHEGAINSIDIIVGGEYGETLTDPVLVQEMLLAAKSMSWPK
jgi:hypothetical protein